jgi:DNA polymerase III sliding clamp (beta) subunit (PCNA family)
MAKKKKIDGFSFKFPNTEILKALSEVMKGLCEDLVIFTTENDLTFQGMDTGRNSFFIMKMDKDKLLNYRTNGTQVIGINSEDLQKIFQRINVNESIVFEFSELDQKIKIKAKDMGTGRTRTFRLAIQDIVISNNKDEVGIIPDLRESSIFDKDYNTFFLPNISDFFEAVKDCEIYSEFIYIVISSDKERVKIETYGTTGDYKYEFTEEMIEDYDFIKNMKACYSYQFIKAIFKLEPITKSLEISLENPELPLKLDFELENDIRAYYFIGARVDSDDYDDDDFLDDLELNIKKELEDDI